MSSIGEVSADGSNLHRWLPEWHPGEETLAGNWSPDGKLFLFSAIHNGRSDIWVVREKGDVFHKVSHEPVQLTSGPLSFYSPQPSGDGKKIFVIGEQRRGELVRYDAKSGLLVLYLSALSALEVSFSRDGQWVAYVSFPEGELWRCRVDGSEKQQLTSAPLFVFSASWSPDGRQLALAAGIPGKPSRLYLVPADGGSPRELPVAEVNVSRVSWAADGNVITFQDTSRPESSFIRSVDLKSLQVATLPGSEQLQIPVRSPNGRYLVASTVNGQKLMLFEFASQKWSEVASMSVGFTQWSADSNYVYFDTGYSVDPAIYRVRIADHKLERIASLKDFRRAVTSFVSATWSGLTPDGSPLLMRDTGTQEVYELDFDTE